MPHCTDINTLEYHTVAGSCETKSICKKGTLRMSIFFDGTGNDDQVEEEYSNVRKLFDVYTKTDYDPVACKGTTSAYIRGVGSRQSANTQSPAKLLDRASNYIDEKRTQAEDLAGGGLGTGGFRRINHMTFKIQEAIQEFKTRTNFYPLNIDLDIFGFSRGAIQARHFVNVMKQGFYKLDGPYSDYKPSDFTIKTLNIFDSVSSFALVTVTTPGRPQDPGWAFGINNGWVKKTIHFLADDEYRMHFDGQPVYQSHDLDYPRDMESDSLTELIFLGAHSDIGGGYRMRHHGRSSNHLARIYLNKMYDMVYDNGKGIPFQAKPSGGVWDVPRELNTLFDNIQDYYKRYKGSSPEQGLKIAHKRFRERMGQLYNPSSGQARDFLLPAELNAKIADNQTKRRELLKEQQRLALSKSTSQKYEADYYAPEQIQGQLIALSVFDNMYQQQLNAYNELRAVFNGNNKDYSAFVKTSIEFHNTYVHKSHSTLVGTKDYDGDDKLIEGGGQR